MDRGSITLKLEVFDNSEIIMQIECANFDEAFAPTSSAKCANSSELYYVHALMILSSMTEQWRQAVLELWTRTVLVSASEKDCTLQEEGGGLTATAWKLYDLAWQLITALQKGAEGGVGLTGAEDPTQQTSHLPGIAGYALGAMPFGLDKHLASLPMIGRQEGESLVC